MYPSKQTLPPAFHRCLRSTCLCQHCPGPGQPREPQVPSPGSGVRGPGCQRPWKGLPGERGCPSGMSCIPAPQDPSAALFPGIHTLALSLENSQTQRKELISGPGLRSFLHTSGSKGCPRGTEGRLCKVQSAMRSSSGLSCPRIWGGWGGGLEGGGQGLKLFNAGGWVRGFLILSSLLSQMLSFHNK